MNITRELIINCYQVAKKIYESNGTLTKADGIRELVEIYGMNKSSSTTYIRAFNHLMIGDEFKRTLSAESFDYFLKSICLDYGVPRLQIALSSLYKHILYFEKIENSEMILVRKVYDSFFSEIPKFSKDDSEQDELESIFIDEQSRKKIVEDLSNLREKDSEFVEILGKRYKRDNKTIVQLKILRDFKCQICNHTILKSNGKKYIEAAHIKPKSQRGRESPDNILILCPNHHKEFDHGTLKIILHTEDSIQFHLNGQDHKLNLSLN